MVVNDIRKEIERVAGRYAELLKKEMNIDSIYLYGSYINGDYTEDSDIDIAVIAEEFTGDIVEDTLRLMKLRRKIDNRIDPHPFKNYEDPFIEEIIDTGVKIA